MLGNIGKIYLFFAGVLFIDVYIELCECVASYSDLEKWDTKIWGGFGSPKLRFADFRNIHMLEEIGWKFGTSRFKGIFFTYLIIFQRRPHWMCWENSENS